MDKDFVVGIDIGGQSCKLGVVDARGEVLAQSVIKTNDNPDADVIIKELAEAVIKLVAQAGKHGQIRGIGVGAPNGNYYTGSIAFAPNLPWAAHGEVKFAQKLSEACGGIPVSLTNDANAAAVGEMTYGVAKGMKNFIMITLGTGVGSGIVVNGEVLYGSDGFAGELGHTIAVRHNGRLCGCGRNGCLEAYCSAIGVARTAREWLDMSEEPSLLREVQNITSKDVFDAAEKGDLVAKEIFDYTGHLLGEKLADYVHFSSPEAIILFGGLTKAGHWIMDPIREAMEANLMPIWKGKIPVSVSVLKDSDAAILGASSLAW
jgi:glucokinase